MNYTKALTDVLLAVLPTVTGTLGALAARYILALSKNKRFALLSAIALHAVQAAEEIGLASGGTVRGAEKLQHATSTLMNLASEAHIKVSSDQATRMVLAALTEFRAALGQLGQPGNGLSPADLTQLLNGFDEEPQEVPQPGDSVPLTLPVATSEPAAPAVTPAPEDAPTTLP